MNSMYSKILEFIIRLFIYTLNEFITSTKYELKLLMFQIIYNLLCRFALSLSDALGSAIT